MSRHDRTREVLRALVVELRDEPTRELDWGRVDATVRGLPALEPARRRPLWTVGALAATLAGLAAALGLAMAPDAPKPAASVDQAARRAIDPTAIPRAPGEGGALDLAALHEGDLVEATSTALTFVRTAAVRWTLAPSSRARIRALGRDGVGHVVALEEGSLQADVTPRPASEGLVEAFAVEVGATRVAVHGTSFRVTRRDADVVVAVERGAVAVGPVGHVGATTGRLLVAPMRAAFSLDGGRSARFISAEEAAAPSLTERSRPLGAAPSIPSERHPPPAEPNRARPAVADAPRGDAAPAKAAGAAPHLTSAAVQATLARCFDDAFAARSSNVKLTVSSTLHLDLRGDGTIAAARFEPPLLPALQACAERMMSGAFSGQERTMSIPIQFER